MSVWDEAAVVEAMARGRCKRLGTAQCAALCLRHTATFTSNGQCPEVVTVYGKRCAADLADIAPHLAARDAAVRREALEEAAIAIEARTQTRPGYTRLWNTLGRQIRTLATDAKP